MPDCVFQELFIILGLVVQALSLLWNHPLSFIAFVTLGGLLLAIGIVLYLLTVVNMAASPAEGADARPQPREALAFPELILFKCDPVTAPVADLAYFCCMKSNFDLNQTPLVVIWEVTRACDLACFHCRASVQPQPRFA